MESLICFEAFKRTGDALSRYLSGIRKICRPKYLLMISDGDLEPGGTPFDLFSRDCAALGKEGDADLVLSLPYASILGGLGKRDFALAALSQRLHASDRIVLPCRPAEGQSLEDCIRILKSCAMTIFKEKPEYREALLKNMKEQMSFDEARMQAVRSCISAADETLSFPVNRQAVKLLDAMLQLYYLAKTEFLDVRELGFSGEDEESGKEEPLKDRAQPGSWSSNRLGFERKAAEKLRQILPGKTCESLRNIAGCTDQMISALAERKEEFLQAEYLQQAAELLGRDAPGEDAARLYLLRIILNITHSTMQINGLHIYTPYCYVLYEDPEKKAVTEEIRKASWVSCITDGKPDTETALKYPSLLEIDHKAEELLYNG